MMKRFFKEYVLMPEKLRTEIIKPFYLFFKAEASSSILLMCATAVALLWANSPLGTAYHHFWDSELSVALRGHMIVRSLREWINEGLMTIFFFIVGLEIKREVSTGELASLKKALLPVGAALGGMVFPAFVYFGFNHGTPTVHGWGIAMATDIAFALGALFVLGKKIPLGLRVFLSALAIVDDLGAVVVIALFYTETIALSSLALGLVAVILMVIANLLWVRRTLVYALLGIGLWFALLGSGIHATVAGVLVAMCIPARGKYDTDRFLGEVSKYLGEFHCPPDGCGHSILLNEKHRDAVQSIEFACHDVETPLQRLEHSIHPWVAYLVIPLFALANAGLTFGTIDIAHAFTSPVTLGVGLGLLFGKPIGIVLFSYLFTRKNLSSLPAGVSWPHLIGAGILGGIGFTMSLFITSLSFSDPLMLDFAKVGILIASFISGVVGIAFLYVFSVRQKERKD
ncbi:MAG TPA: Na+/H+ antiporter NhaA [Thermodesulfovibrionales bacterium]|nr:Na+/H+ antiporter NhaA [Thermodesulfovibrionales bacterium]